ncbi:Hypothetical predicted protein [Xyrichtys novacula]|uniref:Uncharacterized protein n=1 Tax=Xyrichtys novacula TaxID=13765 RepID=A0AAV1H2K0_XYRNO|nr:Hypothetical predicted protein [Xyrichtys novacula]
MFNNCFYSLPQSRNVFSRDTWTDKQTGVSLLLPAERTKATTSGDLKAVRALQQRGVDAKWLTVTAWSQTKPSNTLRCHSIPAACTQSCIMFGTLAGKHMCVLAHAYICGESGVLGHECGVTYSDKRGTNTL